MWAPDVVYSRTHRLYYLSFVVTDTNEAGGERPGAPTTTRSASPPAHPRPARGRSATPRWWLLAGRHRGLRLLLDLRPGRPGGHRRDQQRALLRQLLRRGIRPARHPDPRRDDPYRHRPPGDARTEDRTCRRPGEAATGHPDGDRQGARCGLRPAGHRSATATRAPTSSGTAASTTCSRRPPTAATAPLTGYSVFAGRSRSPLGPFIDREGNSLLAGRVGGTPVLSMNGNRWVGTGHNTVFRTSAGSGGRSTTPSTGRTRTSPVVPASPSGPPLLDPLDWVNGWPTVRGGPMGLGYTMPAPAAQPGQRSRYRPTSRATRLARSQLDAYSDEFDGTASAALDLGAQPPAAATYGVSGGASASTRRPPTCTSTATPPRC